MRTTNNPLTPALQTLLETALALKTTNNKVLARHLFLSEETVKSNFRRISALLNTHSRPEAILGALSRGWIRLPEPSLWAPLPSEPAERLPAVRE